MAPLQEELDAEIEEMLAASVVTMKPQVPQKHPSSLLHDLCWKALL